MRKNWKHIVRNIFFAGLGICFVFGGIILIWLGTAKIPDFKSFDDRKVLNSTKIYDRTGTTLLYDLHQDVKRTTVDPAKMGVNIKNATVAIEDSEFYQHSGIRIKSIFRALYQDVLKGGSQGGSTITQQLVKNSLLTQEKTLSRKFKEWIISIKIEQTMTKDEILGLYLNEAPYGGNVYGIQEASQLYFKKNPEDLTLAEAAYLAAIPQAPTRYSPFGKGKPLLDARKDTVLARMHTLGFITDVEYTSAKNEVIVFQPQELVGIRAPHFVFYIRDYLIQKYGEDMVYSGGLKVTTTLDWDLQQKAEAITKQYALDNEKKYKASNAGLVAIDPKTGQVLVMVGSRDYFDPKIDGQYNIATAKRQPGSSFKPFAYATAFKKGFLPETVVMDVPTEFSTWCTWDQKPTKGHTRKDCYDPANYDNLFKGPIAMRSALAESRNVPSVETLYLAGISDTIKTARDMGIRTLVDANQYGLTLVLGGGEVELLDMTSAYGVFANSGVRETPTSILSITDKNGNTLETFQKNESEILLKNVALQISNILSDNTARAPTFGLNSPLHFAGRQVAAKTGTTNDNKDAWLVGYTPSISVGVWSGNNDNTPMTKSSSAISGPLWHAFMNEILKTVPVEEFEDPQDIPDYTALKPVLRGKWQGNDNFFVDTISGGLATVLTPDETKKEFVVTNVHSILQWVNKDDPLGAVPTNPDSDSQYKLWEPAVQKWWTAHQSNYEHITLDQKPAFEDSAHTAEHLPNISITSPVTTISYSKDTPITVSFTSSGFYPVKKVDVLINGNYSGSNTTPPFSYTFTPSGVGSISATNELTVIVYDDIANKKEFTTEFSVSE